MVDPALFWIFTAFYVVATAYLGYLGYKHTKGSEDFMLAGRKVHPWIIGISYGATFISTSAIVGFGGVSARLGMGLIFLAALNIGLGVLIAFVVFGKRTRRIGQQLKAVTFPDLMGKRYGSRFLHFVSGLMILIAMPLYASAVLIGGSQFLSITLSIDYNVALLAFALVTAIYVVLGGLMAVMYTDAMQGVIMVIGMIILLVLTYSLLGGVTEAHSALTGMGAQGLIPADLVDQGMTSWTTMPEMGSPIWLTLVTTIILGVGIGVLAQPQLVVRFMTAKDNKALTKAIPVGALFILLTTGVAYTVGPLTNVWFWNNQGMVSVDAAGGNVDRIIPLFINNSMPDLFVVAFMLVLLAAAMSTLSGIFHTMGTSAGYDVWKHIRTTKLVSRLLPGDPSLNDKPSLRATRYATAVMIVASVLLAFVMPGNIIARATAMFMGLCACAFLPAYCMAIFSKKPSKTAATWSLVIGAVSWFLWTVFVHTSEASQLGICQALFKQATLLGSPFNVIDPMVVALPLAIVALAAGWAYDRYVSEDSGDAEIKGRAGAQE